MTEFLILEIYFIFSFLISIILYFIYYILKNRIENNNLNKKKWKDFNEIILIISCTSRW